MKLPIAGIADLVRTEQGVAQQHGASRRDLLRAISVVLPSCAFLAPVAWSQDGTLLDSIDEQVPRVGLLRVTILPPDGQDIPAGMRVEIRMREEWIPLPRGATDRVYEQSVPTGATYRIRVSASGFRNIEREVLVNTSLAATRVYLLPIGWSSFLASGIEVPFERRPRFAAVVVRASLSASEIARLNAIAVHEGFVPLIIDPSSRESLDSASGSVLYFEPRRSDESFFSFDPAADRSHGRVPPDAVNRLRTIFAAYAGRVGSPINVRPGEVRILDNQYVVRLAGRPTEDEVRRFATSIGARVVRQVEPKIGFWLIEFNDPQNLGRHLEEIARHVSLGTLESGEPNLMSQFKQHAPQDGLKGAIGYVRTFFCDHSGSTEAIAEAHDPYEACQANLGRQSVQRAWSFLEELKPGAYYGLPSVRVATIDSGITFNAATKKSSHPDVNVTLLKYCYNVQLNRQCDEIPDIGPDPHGMASYGIIAGTADNDFGITGIAPNTTHIAVDGSAIVYDQVQYSELLAWVGGIGCVPPDQGVDSPPIPAADVISCSHGLEETPVFTQVVAVLEQLATRGRNGRGTVVVYSAGNRDCAVPDQFALPCNPHTIGVANTMVQDGIEKRWRLPAGENNAAGGSNCSPFIDLCAFGDGAPSMTMRGDDVQARTPKCDGSEESRKGVVIHGGTSAAASMVAAAAALVLTANPLLSWRQVRNVLRASAVKIDCAASDDGPDFKGRPRNGKWRRVNPSDEQQATPLPCSNMQSGLQWFSDFYGYGRLDVYCAVKLAAETQPEALPVIPDTCPSD